MQVKHLMHKRLAPQSWHFKNKLLMSCETVDGEGMAI